MTMVSSIIFYAGFAYCGTMPSVEFYQFLRALTKGLVIFEKDPNLNPKAIKRQMVVSTIAAVVGGTIAGLVLNNTTKEPYMAIVGAYIGGRVIYDGVRTLMSPTF